MSGDRILCNTLYSVELFIIFTSSFFSDVGKNENSFGESKYKFLKFECETFFDIANYLITLYTRISNVKNTCSLLSLLTALLLLSFLSIEN